MKSFYKIFIMMFFSSFFLVAQNTADLSIENPTSNGTKFSFEIHITPTSNWGPFMAIGNSSWFFAYNSAALSNPSLTFVGAVVSNAEYTNSVILTGGKIGVTTAINVGVGFGTNLIQGTNYHVYTVELDIDNAAMQALLEWDQVNSGIFTAVLDAQVVENYVGSGDVPLPVELSSFSVNTIEGSKAQLQWETATEVNNYGFEIERSVVSSEKAKVKSENEAPAAELEREWETVTFVKGHGNSNSTKIYSFTDKNLVGGSKFMYRLKQIDIDGTFEYSDAVEIEVLPTKYELLQNYPNPFNPETNIRFSLPEDAKIAINIYNILGEKVVTLLNEELNAGFHQVNFNTNSAGYKLASGMYIYTIETKNFSQVKKMILMK